MLFRSEEDSILPKGFDIPSVSAQIHWEMLAYAKSSLEDSQAKILLELAKSRPDKGDFRYQSQKLLYQIKAHPATRPLYAKCCEYLHRFYTQRQPDGMDFDEWCRIQLTEKKVITYLRRALQKQVPKPKKEGLFLVKRDNEFAYKAYGAAARKELKDGSHLPVPICQAVDRKSVV